MKMEVQPHRPNRRVKVESNPEDRISALPDCLLIHILSFLPTTKDAARLGILSKRWLNLWTHLPVLLFDRTQNKESLHFANYVDEALTLHASPNLQLFQIWGLPICEIPYVASRLSFWLCFAVLKQAKDLSLVLEGAGDLYYWENCVDPSVCYALPHFFYTNPSLRRFKTTYCNFAPTGNVEWASLRVLEIGFSTLNNETLRCILSGSPVLESLKLYKCVGIDEVDIGSSCHRLETLVIDHLWLSLDFKEYATYLISGSSIQHLEICGGGFQKWKLDNVPSLVSVKLDFHIDIREDVEDMEYDEVNEYFDMCREVVRELLEKVHHVEQLELGTWCIEVLSSLEVKGVPAPFIDCKLLILNLRDMERSSVPGMASLLLSSSNLEKLAIHFSGNNNSIQFEDPDICHYEFEDNYWRSNKRICNCLFLHLKTVEIFNLSEGLYREGFLYQLIEFLLKNASLFVHRDGYCWETENAVTMVEELLSSPCVVIAARK